jgi:hypothetical protein
MRIADSRGVTYSGSLKPLRHGCQEFFSRREVQESGRCHDGSASVSFNTTFNTTPGPPETSSVGIPVNDN